MRFALFSTVGVLLLSTQLTVAFPAPPKTAANTANTADLEKDFPEALKGDGLLDIVKHPRIQGGKIVARGPCPFLNTAANHGFLPHSGTGITPAMLEKLLKKVGGPDWFAKGLAGGIPKLIKAKVDKDPKHSSTTLDLSDLNTPRESEHDLSLTRHDMTDATTPLINPPDETLVNGLIQTAKDMSTNKQSPTHLTYASIGSWRKKRYAQEYGRKLASGTVHYPSYGIKDPKALLLASGETMFILEFFGQNGVCREDVARSILLKEEFPQGWQAHKVKSSNLILGIGSGINGYYTPDFVLNWWHWWSAPAEVKEAAKTETTGEKVKNSPYGQQIMKLYNWAFNRDATPPPQTTDSVPVAPK